MQINSDQKKILSAIALAVVTLSVVTFYKRSDFRYADKTDYQALQKKQEQDLLAYQKYLTSLPVDSEASKQLFETLLTKEGLEKELDAALITSQAPFLPAVSDSDIQISEAQGRQPNLDYLAKAVGLFLTFNSKTKEANQKLFSGDEQSNGLVKSEYLADLEKLKSLYVPLELKEMQRSLVSAFMAYGKLIETSSDYAKNPTVEPWPEVYQSYISLNDRLFAFNEELQKVSNKYDLAEAKIKPSFFADQKQKNQKDFSEIFIPKAQALFGFGDLTITVGDIPQIVKDAVEEGLTAAFSQFMSQFVQKMVNKIESNYLIANFLYYSDALVSGQYANDYLNKYVESSFDREIVKKLIPQFSCGKNDPALKQVFKAKAKEFLGFNPEAVDPNDPEYFFKMSKVGNYLASAEGWEQNFQDLANQARSEAEKAVERELLSPGLKTPRDVYNKVINLSSSGIVSAQRANLNAIMQLGIGTAKNFISKFVTQVTQVMVNNFVFRGAAPSGNPVGVLKEQSTCLAAAQFQAIIPASSVTYEDPKPTPDADDLLRQQCAQYPRGCEQLVEPEPIN